MLFWVALAGGWSLMQPSLSTAIGEVAHPLQRGAAMGLLMGMMSLGRTLAPLFAGFLYESTVFITEDYLFTEVDGPFGRKSRDPSCAPSASCTTTVVAACEAANADAETCAAAGACTFTAGSPNTCVTTVDTACAAANADVDECTAAGACSFLAPSSGCTLPAYPIIFQPVFSMAPYLLGTTVSAIAVIVVLVYVPRKAPPPPGRPAASGVPGGHGEAEPPLKKP
jgi:hypothetical protein